MGIETSISQSFLFWEIANVQVCDVEGDSDVDITDFNALASNYDPSGANAPHDWTEGDFDDNDTIDLTDFNGLATNFSPGGYGGGAD